MHLDGLAAAALAAELQEALAGARVQDALALDRLSLALELYTGRRLYLSLSADAGREGLGLGETRLRRGDVAATPLALAARRHLVGARLVAVHAPERERILHLRFRGEAGWLLVAELMGRMANVLLLRAEEDEPAEGAPVVALARPVTHEMTRARELLPGRPYAPPPTPPKAPPSEVDAARIAGWLEAAAAEPSPPPAFRVLLRSVAGFGPLAAREIVHRATGAATTTPAEADAAALADALAALLGPRDPADDPPSVARPAPGSSEILAWAPYELRHLDPHGEGRLERCATTLEALGRFQEAQASRDPYRPAREAVLSEVDAAARRVARRRDALAREVAGLDPEALEALRLKGDLILAHQWQLAPGQTELEAPWDPEGPPLRIVLDPERDALENARAYFDRYKRKKRAAKRVPARLAAAEAALATLEQLAVDARLAESRDEIDAVHDALIEGGWLRAAARKRPRSAATGAPLSWTSSDGVAILVGRNSRQNEALTFGRAARDDLWLHARDVPGAHVVVRRAGRPELPERTLREAAALAAWYSALRDAASADVAATELRHVRRLRGGGPGMVRFEHERTIRVRPRSIEQLEAGAAP